MADNTRMKEMQADIKRATDFMEYAKGRFDQLDQMSGILQSISKSVDSLNIRLDQSRGSSEASPSAGMSPPNTGYQSQYGNKSIKLDFPRFDGTDALDWIFKADQYFKYYEVPDSQKLVIASVHFDGDVLPWFQMLEKTGRIPTWQTLTKAVEIQYGPSQFDCARS